MVPNAQQPLESADIPAVPQLADKTSFPLHHPTARRAQPDSISD
jgi:hypothetical protein